MPLGGGAPVGGGGGSFSDWQPVLANKSWRRDCLGVLAEGLDAFTSLPSCFICEPTLRGAAAASEDEPPREIMADNNCWGDEAFPATPLSARGQDCYCHLKLSVRRNTTNTWP